MYDGSKLMQHSTPFMAEVPVVFTPVHAMMADKIHGSLLRWRTYYLGYKNRIDLAEIIYRNYRQYDLDERDAVSERIERAVHLLMEQGRLTPNRFGGWNVREHKSLKATRGLLVA